MKSPLYLLDSYAFIYRSYFAFLSRPLRNASGANVSAAFGFFRFLFNLFDERNPGAFAAVFDPKGKNFRHELYPEYKANRQKTPEDLHAQVPLVEEILKALGLPILRAEGYEADDVIATLAERCRAEGRECWIVSGDKDLLQLVGGPVKALRPDSNFAYSPYGPEEVRAEWGVSPERILDYLTLTGDASDNVPGVPGVGDKTAQKLLSEYDGVDEIYARLAEVKPEGLRRKLEAGRESAELSKRLITLAKDVALPLGGLEELEVGPLDRVAANPLFLREGMRSLAVPTKEAAAKAGPAAGAELFESGASSGAGAGGPAVAAIAPDGVAAALGLGAGQGSAAGPSGSAAPEAAEGLPPELSGEGSYETVATGEALRSWVDRCLAAGAFAFDCETDSLDERAARPVGFSLSYEPRKACYVPLLAPDGPCLAAEAAAAELRRLFAAKEALLVGQNVKYDYAVMRRFAGPMECRLFDTMVAAWLLDAEAGTYGLEALAERHLGYRGLEFEEVVPKGSTFADVPVEKATRYAAEDADLTYRLYRLFGPRLASAGQEGLFRDLEMPLVPILAGMEEAGIGVEAPELKAYGVELEARLAGIEREIYALVGREFNIASTKQLQEILFLERKLPAGKKTKTGFSTDTSVLEELAGLDPVPALILKHRGLSKLKSTYVEALVRLAEEGRAAAGTAAGGETRIHTHYAQAGTATGRLSSRDPNLQNIPIRDEEGRRIRQAFVASPGRLLVSADYAQIELVVLAHLSGDPGLERAFREGVDVHRRTASLLFKAAEAEVSPEQRRIAKTINFGVIYGMSAFRLANELKIPRGEAQGFIDAYFATYAGVTDFIRKTVAETEERGYTTTLLGRRRPIPAINSKNKTEKQAAERVAVNTPIQGSAADIIKLAMIRVDRALRAELPRCRLLLQVHDELIVEAPEAEAEAAAALMRREMEAAVVLAVPLRASVEWARSWGDMH
ncbi:MAG TPA: DNA polymerase I [Spirochaetia bacterium]|nr:DNA polymerase I [Spirochaetales bacterium]HRY71697.1 DNA polymerase I [Spirochaetia bacterium]